MLNSWLLSSSYLMSTDSSLTCLGLVSRWALPGLTRIQHRMIKQISPDKSMNCNSTTASFTVSAEPWALLSCASLPADSAFYDVSVRRLTALLQASFPRYLAASQLPFASNYCTLIILKYRGSLTGDLNPISSCPCRAYTIFCSRLRGCFVIYSFLHFRRFF